MTTVRADCAAIPASASQKVWNCLCHRCGVNLHDMCNLLASILVDVMAIDAKIKYSMMKTNHDAKSTRDVSHYSDNDIEQAIYSVVRTAFREDEADLLTYRRVRTATEEKLNLAKGSLKDDTNWSQKSKEVIDDALVCLSLCVCVSR